MWCWTRHWRYSRMLDIQNAYFQEAPCWSFANVCLVKVYRPRNPRVKLWRNKHPTRKLENLVLAHVGGILQTLVNSALRSSTDESLHGITCEGNHQGLPHHCQTADKTCMPHGNGECGSSARMGFTYLELGPNRERRSDYQWSPILFRE